MRKLLLAGMVSVCLLAGQAQATIINLESNAYTLFSEQRLFTGKGVEVYGVVGAIGEVRLGKNTHIYGDVYTNGRFKAASLSRVEGRLIAGDDIKIVKHVEMGGLQWEKRKKRAGWDKIEVPTT